MLDGGGASVRASGPERSAAAIALAVLVAGFALRLHHLLGDRSLWVDEGLVLESLFTRSFAGLLAPLENAQMAPYGWLWAARLAIEVVGPTVLAARIPSFLAGVAALGVFAWLAWRGAGLRPWPACFAIAAFALLEPQIYFSAEVKQYSADVLAACLGLLAFLRLRGAPLAAGQAAGLALFGAVLVWFSHPAAFILAGVGLGLFGARAQARDWRGVFLLAGIGAAWLLSFAVMLWLSAADPTFAFKRAEAFHGRFAPLPPTGPADLMWYWNAMHWLFDALGFALPGLGALVLLAGAVALARRDPWLAVAALLPLPVAVLASAAELYPFWHRMLLFLAPGLLIGMAAGIGALSEGGWPARLTGTVAALLLLAVPASQSVAHGLRAPPYAREEIKPLMARLAATPEAGPVFVAFGAVLGWRIHAPEVPGVARLTLIPGPDPSRLTEGGMVALMRQLAPHGVVHALFITDSPALWTWKGIAEPLAFDLFARLAGAEGETVGQAPGALLRRYRFGVAPDLLADRESGG